MFSDQDLIIPFSNWNAVKIVEQIVLDMNKEISRNEYVIKIVKIVTVKKMNSVKTFVEEPYFVKIKSISSNKILNIEIPHVDSPFKKYYYTTQNIYYTTYSEIKHFITSSF